MTTVKAPARLCRYCGEEMPAQPSSPGRPRTYCSRRCSREWHGLKERLEREREWEMGLYEGWYAQDLQFVGKREADKRARRKMKELDERHQERLRCLDEFPGRPQ